MEFSSINFDDLPSSISEFFTPEEFAEISDYEKQHLSNLRQNFEALRHAGLPVTPPEFMLRNRSEKARRKLVTPAIIESSDGSDTEWTPALEKLKRPQVNQRKRVFEPPKKASLKDNTKEKVPEPTKRKKQRKKQTDSDDKEVHVYPFRKIRRSSYMSLATLDDDDFLYCEDCRQEYDGDCPVHGPLLVVDDIEIQPSKSDEYSKRTLPEGLVIKKSKIPNAGLGVFAVKDFPSRTRFGPYRGKKEVDETIAHESGYSWQIVKNGHTFHYVDGKDPSKSNWMRYVNCARHEDEQCLTAYQYQGEIYYRSHKPICAGTEILVYYGDSYARDLGINSPKFERKLLRKNNLQESDGNTESDDCEDCRQEYDGDCPVHGPLLVVDDIEIQPSKSDEYSKRTLPEGLVIKKSKIPNAGLGVFAVKDFPARTRFGPYRGKKEVDETIAHESGYSWQIVKNGHTFHYVDGKDPSKSNWMRYVNCARHEDEQCLTAYQYQGEIYYRSHKPICAGTEILVYYGDSYARDLGINSPKFERKLLRKNNLQESDGNTESDGIFSCDDCQLSFNQSWYLQRHMKYRHHNKYLELNCNKLHADFSLVVNSFTNIKNKYEKCDVNMTLNDIDNTKLTVATLSESIQNHVNTVNVSEAGISYNFSSQNDYTDKENDKLCVSTKCTNLTRDDECNIECKIVKSCINEDHGKMYEMCGVNSKEFHKMYSQKDKTTSAGGKTYNPGNAFTVDFANICSAQVHTRIHTGENPGNLKKHTRIHTGEKPGNLKKHTIIRTEKKPYKCDVCNVGFTQSGNLMKHKRIHTGEKPYMCDVCNVCFTQSGHLKTHKIIHTGEKPYKCDVCNVWFTERGSLKKHKRIHTGEKPYKCDVCNVCFTQSGHLKTHKIIHTGEKPYKCDVCNVWFTERGSLKKHKRIHTGEKPYKCDVCNVCFTQSGDLKKHKRIHTGKKPYKCDVCNVWFTERGSLKKHKRIHTGEKPYKCDVCNVCFTQSGDLKKHKRIHTGKKPYKCDVCNVGFTHSGHLKTHKRIHTGEKPYKCDVCNFCFNESGSLKKHKRIHTGEKPYKCDVCNVGFTHSGHLKTHKRIHTGEKPYKCDVCNFCFNESGSLKKHKRIHTGEKPYKCDICNVCFTEHGSLKKHKRIHTGEKPYKCDVCNVCFTQSGDLKKHKRIHTGEKPYKCDVCNVGFTHSGHLKTHKRIHTGEKPYKCDVCNFCFNESGSLKKHKRIHTG